MRIGLYGIYGVYNFGCEAIIRGVHKLLEDMYYDVEVIYFSYNYEYDKEVLKDLPIEVKRIKQKRNFVSRLVNKGCHLLEIPFMYLMFDYNEIINYVDELFLIGGDIITVPAVVREKKHYYYINEMVEFGKKALAKDVPVVLYGASVGPFGEYAKAMSYYEQNLKRYRSIVCREQVTKNYLYSLGITNTIFSPDPAFLVEGTVKSLKKKYIGINLSPLSLLEIYGECREANIIEFARLIQRIYKRYEMDIMLIPHVIAPDKNDDDLRFQQDLIEHLEVHFKEHVILAGYKRGFLGIKEQLPQCRFVVSARMHCAINALHESIPTIFLSYSQKGVGMCEYVYGNKDWVIDLKKLQDGLLDKMDAMLQNEAEIVASLERRNVEIQNYFQKQQKELKRVLGGNGVYGSI